MTSKPHTAGQLLYDLRCHFFNGGGWADYPEWSDHDEAGHAVWEGFAAAIGTDIRRAVAAADLLEAARAVVAIENDNGMGVIGWGEAIVRLEAAIAKATGEAGQ